MRGDVWWQMAKVKGASEDGLEAMRARRKTWHDERKGKHFFPWADTNDQLSDRDRAHDVCIPSYQSRTCSNKVCPFPRQSVP
jgi:hypothetical protein